MTRKHYVMLAAALNVAKQEAGPSADARRGIDLAAEHVADTLAADNPRFDKRRFLTAAGYLQES